MINQKSKATAAEKENFFNKTGTKSLNVLFKKKPKQVTSPERKSNFKYSENYLEKLQSDLSRKIKEKKISKLSNKNLLFSEKQVEREEQEFSAEKHKEFKTSKNASKLNLNNSQVPFKISEKVLEDKDSNNIIKEFTLEDSEHKFEKEEELETVFKKNENNILDMSVNFIVNFFCLFNLLKYINEIGIKQCH